MKRQVKLLTYWSVTGMLKQELEQESHLQINKKDLMNDTVSAIQPRNTEHW